MLPKQESDKLEVNDVMFRAGVLIKQLGEYNSSSPLFAYGDANRIIVCYGYDHAATKSNSLNTLSPWQSIWHTLNVVSDDYICGYIPFEFHPFHPAVSTCLNRQSSLFIPATVVEITNSQSMIIKDLQGVGQQFLESTIHMPLAELENLSEYDFALYDAHSHLFESAVSWAQGGKYRRLTVARKLWLQASVDLYATFFMSKPNRIEKVFF